MKTSSLCFVVVFYIAFGCEVEDITQTSLQNCTVELVASSKSHPRSAALQELMDEYVGRGLPAINLMVSDPAGTFISSSGMADIKNGIRMQPCHISKSASITKMFMTVLTLKLQEEGVLRIDDPLTLYLSSDDLKDIENATQVSLRDLMRHSTGIYDVITDEGFYLQVLNDPTRHWAPSDLLKFVRGKKADFKPNSTSGYSNTNTLLLSMAINKATGVPHSQLLRSKIIEPLGLNDTYYHWHDQLPEKRVAQGYFDLYHNGKILNLSNWNTGSGNGYGGIYSTVMDLHAFMKALLENKTVLSQESLNTMLTFDESVNESRKYLGVGIFKDFIDLKPGLYAYGHRGRDLAYSADLFYFPDQQAIMALAMNYGTDSESNLKSVFLEFRDRLALLISD
jgi:D-alanyl-D-alanine carboxypeptidase